MKKGIYLQGTEQIIGSGIDQTKLVKHVIAQVDDPTVKTDGSLYVDDPQIRITYLQPGVLEVLPSGTPITFEFDVKQKKRNDGTKYEVIIPVEIKAVAKKSA